MFTGIIEDVGTIQRLQYEGQSAELAVATPLAVQLQIGDSIAVDGCCLTVSGRKDTLFTAVLSPETIQRTTFRRRQPGDGVNLERPLCLGDGLGGHLVQGHIDTKGTLEALEKEGDCWRYFFAVQSRFSPYLVEKGSIAIDGISLTIAALTEAEFQVAIIPLTYTRTALSEREPGDEVNVEFDMLGKYVRRSLQAWQGEALASLDAVENSVANEGLDQNSSS